jgi:hypothetical protein
MLNIKEINYFKLSIYFYKITIFLIIVISFGFIFFLYNNVYLVLIKAEETTELKVKTISEIIEKDKLDNIILKIEEKEKVNLVQKPINNPLDNKEPEQ